MKNEIRGKEYFINLLAILIATGGAGYLIYGHVWGSAVLLPAAILIMKERKKQLCEKRTRFLESAFKDMLVSLSDSLRTGHSLENAFVDSYRDMKIIYGYHDRICKELRRMISQLKLNITVEDVMSEFALRTELPSAKLFAEIITITKRTGGDINEVIANITNIIVEKENVREEIEVEIHEKKIEEKMMLLVPAVLIIYVSVTSPEFFKVMYSGIAGHLIMTLFLVLYILGYLWANHCIRKGETW